MKNAGYYNGVYQGEYHVDHERAQRVAALCKGLVLDVGCGDGALSGYYNGIYVGTDFSSVAIEVATRSHPGKTFIHCDFLKEPLPKGEWGTVVLGEVLEHITDEAQEALFSKLNLNGATLVVSVPNSNQIPDPSHVREFDVAKLEETLSGFGSVLVREHGRYLVATVCQKRPKLSVCLIVKNEEELLGRCLESLKDLGDELVIVDTGSTDRTIEIAKSYGARIGHFEWCDDFAAARNYAESLCLGEYIYWQDGDEELQEGRDLIREIVEKGERDGVRPKLILSRNNGRPAGGFVRQEMLHKNNREWSWHGAAHNYLKGPASSPEPRIVVEHLRRPSGDRPNHKDPIAALRSNLGSGFDERHLFYLLRDHWYAKHYQEAIALAELLLSRPVHWPLQRSHTAIIAGESYLALGQKDKARASFIKAVWEYGGWAEPYFALGKSYYNEGVWAQGAAWFYASLPFDPPQNYFADYTIYDWRRCDLLAVCLYKMGRSAEAERYGQIALAFQPEDERLQANQSYYRRACEEAKCPL